MRDLSAQYRQTYLGYFWVILPPLVASATFIFLQSQGILRIAPTDVPYPAFVMMGTLLWQTFVDAIQSPMSGVLQAKAMLTKVNFHREAILMAGLYMVGFTLLVRLCLLAIVMAMWGVTPGFGLLGFPLAMAGLLALGFAVGLIILPLGSLYGDVGRGIPIVLQFWMLLTPVVYPVPMEGIAGWIATLNPTSSLIVTAREALSGQVFTQLPAAALTCVFAATLSLAGVIAFRLAMPLLIERMGS